MNKTERIKAEVERRLSDCGYAMGSENSPIIAKILYESYRSLLLFINSLEEEPASNDLEEAANSCSSCIYLEEVLSDDDKEVLKERLVNTFKAGAQWQKEKMMEDAVDGEIYFSMDYLQYRINTEPLAYFHHGDKVKLIIVKEE